MKIALIGSGVYATAISKVMNENNKIFMWTEKEESTDTTLSENITISNSYQCVVQGADIIFILVASKYVIKCIKDMKEYLSDDSVLVLGSKGLDIDGCLLTESIEKISKNNLAVLSGPTFAKDILSGDPVGFTVACNSINDYEKIKNCFKNVFLEYSSDIVEVEMAGSLKNAYAIGSGIVSNLGYGYSTLCLYLTKVIYEIKNIYKEYGVNSDSVITLAGLGDLILSCTNEQSRNNFFGKLVATQESDELMEYLKHNTVEGYENIKSYCKKFDSLSIDTPILNTIKKIIDGDADSKSLVETLLK